MTETIRQFKWFTIADFKEEEVWLEAQHRKGWKLIKSSPFGLFTFEKCDPEDVTYRLEYQPKKVREDYVQLYQDYGWEFVTRKIGWNYFVKSNQKIQDDHDAQIFSDNFSRIEMLDKVFKTRLLPVSILLLIFVIPNFVSLLGQVNSLFKGILSGLYLILILVDVYLVLYTGMKLYQLRKEIERWEIKKF